jgi:hypothetical protein
MNDTDDEEEVIDLALVGNAFLEEDYHPLSGFALLFPLGPGNPEEPGLEMVSPV